MATVNKRLADIIKDGDGFYLDSGDPRVHRIIEYTDMGGQSAYGLEYEHQIGKYAASPWVKNPKIYFQVKD